MKSYGVTIQMKPLKNINMVPLIFINFGGKLIDFWVIHTSKISKRVNTHCSISMPDPASL